MNRPSAPLGKIIAQYPELRGMSGGSKAMWLRLHSEVVISFYKEHGSEATREAFQIKLSDTLESLISSVKPVVPGKNWQHPGDLRWDPEYVGLVEERVREDVRELRRQVDELAESYGQFTELVAERISRGFILPLLLPLISKLADFRGRFPKLTKTDPLVLDSLLNEARRSNMIEGKRAPRSKKIAAAGPLIKP